MKCSPTCSPLSFERILVTSDGYAVLRCRLCGDVVKELSETVRLHLGEACDDVRFTPAEFERAVVRA